eukprot:scaffold179450_cov36-Tisochrysis_lutea.AAC.1
MKISCTCRWHGHGDIVVPPGVDVVACRAARTFVLHDVPTKECGAINKSRASSATGTCMQQGRWPMLAADFPFLVAKAARSRVHALCRWPDRE